MRTMSNGTCDRFLPPRNDHCHCAQNTDVYIQVTLFFFIFKIIYTSHLKKLDNLYLFELLEWIDVHKLDWKILSGNL